MTTDTNLSQIVFNRLSNEKYHELKTSGQLNDQQFYITPDLDTNPGLIQDYMSNCITKIPQHINLELSTDGTLTLKAGSKVYVPNGLDETTPKFDYITVETDVNINNYGTGNTDFFLCYDFANNSLLANANTNSGNTEITSEGFNYNISTNKITFYGITGNIVSQNVSFPIALCSRSSGTPTSIDQVFNGIGYIGAVAFAVPGVQVIIPNGFNSNGQLNNYTATVERVLTNDYANGNLLGHNYPLTLTNSPLLSAGDLIYVEEENQIYKGSIAELNKRTEVEIAKVTTDSTRITSLTPLPIYNRILGSYQTSTSNNIIGNHIGQIGYTTRTDVPEGCAWCDGAEYTQAQFPDVYQMLVDGKIQSLSYTEYQQQITNYGFCETFGLSSTTKKYYAWLRDDGTPFYTLSETPETGEYIYDGAFEKYGVIQLVFENQITVTTNISTFAVDPEHGNTYERDSSQDMEVTDDNAEKKFKVPKLLDKYVMDLADDVPVVGNGMALGLTDGTNDRGLTSWVNNNTQLLSGLTTSYGENVGATTGQNTQTSGYLATGITTDPTKSGMIADTSNLGKTVTLKAYVVLFSSAAGASEVQAAEFINALTNKANTDLSNVPSNIDYVVESYRNGTEWYKIYKSGWVEQGGEINQNSPNWNVPITFLKKFADTNYSFFIMNYFASYTNEGFNYYNSKTEESINAVCPQGTGNVAMWTAEGQGASE